jgi:hypothetical protein
MGIPLVMRRRAFLGGVIAAGALGWPALAMADKPPSPPGKKPASTATPAPTSTPAPTPPSTPTPAVASAPSSWTTQDLTNDVSLAPWNWPYHGFGIGNDGSTLFIACLQSGVTTGGVPFRVLVRYNGTWYEQQVIPSDGFRYIYYMWAPTSGAGGYVVGTQGVEYQDKGWVGGTNYTWCEVRAWYSPNWTTTKPTEIQISKATQTTGGYVQCWARHARIGPDGALYVLSDYEPDDGTGTNQARYARVSGATRTHEGVVTALNAYAPAPNFPAYVSDGVNLYAICTTGVNGTPFNIFSCDSGGAPTGAPLARLNAGAGTYDFLVTAPQGGSQDTSFVDVAYVPEAVAGGQAYLRCMRINLGPAPTIAFDEQVASGLATDDGGNAWGMHQLRCARTPNGTLYVVAQSGSGLSHTSTIYQRTGANTWQPIHSESSIREPAMIALSGDHTIYMEDWPNGDPDVTTGAV